MKAYQSSPASGNGWSRVIGVDQQRELGQFLLDEGRENLLPMLELFQESSAPVNDLMDVMGKAAVEAMLQISAEQIAGPKQQGKRGSDRPIRHHGVQDGIAGNPLAGGAERKLSVKRPRLRKRQGGDGAEVLIPAYEQMRHSPELGKRMLQILLEGVSTRRYERVMPAMADTLGISKSAVSRQIIDEGEKVLKALAERRFDDKEILIIYVDGMQFAGHHILAAVGVDVDGYKHVLGIRQGAAENTATVTALL